MASILKTKAKPKPDETDQGQSNRRYRTRSTTSRPTYDQDDDDIQPPSIDLKQDQKHRYDLRSLAVDFEQQSLHFAIPSTAINDTDPFPVNSSIFPAREIPIHLQPDTHVFLKNYGESTNLHDAIDGEHPRKNLSDDVDAEHPPKTIDLEQYEVILRDEHDNPRFDDKGNPITVICRPPTDLLGRVFLSKSDHRGNRQSRIIEVIKDFEDKVDINQNRLSRNFRVQLERDERQELFDNIMSYNDILNHLE